MRLSKWPWLFLVVALGALTACGKGKKPSKPDEMTAGASGAPDDTNEPGGEPATGGVTSGTGGSGPAPAGGATATGGSSSGLSEIESYASAYASAICQVIKRCWKNYGLQAQESCEASLERQYREGIFANLSAAVADGRVQYRPDAAAQCVNGTASTSCDNGLLVDAPGCSEVFTGTLAEGDDCTLDAECAPDLQCVVTDACPGKCGGFPDVGEPCASPNRCKPGLLCAVGSDGGVCQAPIALGGTCSQTLLCGPLQFCKGLDRSNPQSTGTCAPRDELYSGAEGDACLVGGDTGLCRPELVCVLDDATSAAKGHCAAHVGAGACQLALPDQCPRGQFCKVALGAGEGTCTRNPQVGEPCLFAATESALPGPCPAGAYCDAESNKCEAGKRLGQECSSDMACYSKKCGSTGSCVAPLECE